MKKQFNISSCTLHILAMAFMLCDHVWATVLPSQVWLTCIGRIAFPIFAFMTVEGYCHTHNLKRYMLRLLVFALIAEIPFDLMYGGTVFYPYHQNVLWTFLIALIGIALIERVKERAKQFVYILSTPGIVLICTIAGTLLAVDYYGMGVLTVFVFYFFRQRKWWCLAGQLFALYWINVELLGGQYYPVVIAGCEFELYEQSLALLALIPIWLYNGRQGHHSRAFRYFCYAFYPVHMLLLWLAAR